MPDNKADNQSKLQICNLCEAMCGLEIKFHQDKVISIKGNPNDSFSKGYMCAKALALKDIHEDPCRLQHPVRKTSQGWVKISWEEAFKDIKQQTRTLQKKYGRNSIGLYLGNPRYHHHGSLLASILLKKSLNSRNCYSVASSDHLPHMLAAYHLFGHMAMLPVPDIDRSDFLLCLGANPLVSNGSVMSAPNIKKRLKSLQSRGGKIVTIDPRKTETGELADQHIFIYPGQDTYLLLGMINYIFQHNLLKTGEWQNYTLGLSELEQLSRPFTLEKVAKQTQIEINIIETLSREFATAKSAVAYGRFGICTQKQGTLNAWLIYLINIITGNLDKAGGIMFPLPAADLALMSALVKEKGRFNEFQSSAYQLPSFDSELPSIELANNMLSNRSDTIKGFINIAGNPVLSTPDGKLMEKALEQLEFMVAVDFYINESNQYADIILPPSSPLEKSQYNLTCNLTATQNNARYSSPLFIPGPETKHDWQIFLILSNILNPGFSPRKSILRTISFIFNKLGADGILDLLIRLGPYGFSFRKKTTPGSSSSSGINKNSKINYLPEKLKLFFSLLYKITPFYRKNSWYSGKNNSEQNHRNLNLNKIKKESNGIDLGPMIPSLPGRLFTENKTINLVPEFYLSGIDQIDINKKTRPSHKNNEFILIGRRSPRSMNSWLNDFERLSKGRPSNTLLMHPENAHNLGIYDNEIIRLSANEQSIYAKVEISPSIMQGVLCLPHGWSQLKMKHSEKNRNESFRSNFNDLTSIHEFDPLSGMSVMNNLRVSVNKF